MAGKATKGMARVARVALLFVLGVVAITLVGCGGSGAADTSTGTTPLTGSTGSVIVRVPTDVPSGSEILRVRALQPGTDTNAAPPTQVPLGQGQPATVGILVPVGTLDILVQALDSASHAVAGRKVRVAVTAGSIQQISPVLFPSDPVVVALPSAQRLDVLNRSLATVQGSISLSGYTPRAVAMAPGRTMAFATDVSQKALLPCDLMFGQLNSPAILAGTPQGIAIPSSGSVGYVALQQVTTTADAISSFSLSDGTVQATTAITTGGNPSLSALALTPDGTQILDLWQAAPAATSQPSLEVRRTSDMAVISTTSLDAGAQVGASRMAVSTDGILAAFTYVAPTTLDSTVGVTSVAGGGTILPISANGGTWVDVAFSSSTQLVALDSQGSVWFFNCSGYPVAMDAGTELTLPGAAAAMAVDLTANRLWVALTSGSVVVYDLASRSQVLSTSLGQAPSSLTL